MLQRHLGLGFAVETKRDKKYDDWLEIRGSMAFVFENEEALECIFTIR